ncbi:hypothetical protein [Ktedonobacter racemifer]|uniref:Uncharacterized protein n=1 Tax=Ktedonobacter racemifer DSM 44963 TaxID=485913 RepID=D6U8Q2_KTERA|nr:hypothetical protein [Ktedonobacter racemifer]EFH79612.1 hypothetical protein Krac_0090 [Ktedonobacter racemifer DSM 44963]
MAGFRQGARCSWINDNGTVEVATIINPRGLWECDVCLEDGTIMYNAGGSGRIRYEVPSVVVPVASVPDLEGTNGGPLPPEVLKKYAVIECYYSNHDDLYWKVWQEYFPDSAPLLLLWHPGSREDGLLTEQERTWRADAVAQTDAWRARRDAREKVDDLDLPSSPYGEQKRSPVYADSPF